jgi:hypothetical protein
MFEIRNYEPKPVIVIRAATAEELAAYNRKMKEHKEKIIDAKI